MHSLANLLAERITSGLKRKSATVCSKWAEQYRVMGGKSFPGPWTFKYHPWLKEMMNSTAQENTGKKSAQMGYTEAVLNRALFKIDIESVDVLYVLPSKTPDASDFSAARFDAALELSPHLRNMFSSVKNVGHKKSGSVNLYIRGAKSRAGLKSIPVGFIVLDEVDEMDKEVIPLAKERQSGQLEKETWFISTPTIDNKGIDSLFKLSSQEHFFFICPSCSRRTELIFPECLEVTADSLLDPNLQNSFLKCKECKNQLHHQTKYEWLETGKWVPSNNIQDHRGFYINQLYSSTITPVELATSFLRGQSNQADEQEFYNSKLGLAHSTEGSKITDAMIIACMGGHIIEPVYNNKIITMGVDVGTWLHCEIDEWTIPPSITTDLNVEARPRVLSIEKHLSFDQLNMLMKKYRVMCCVIDAHPERRKAFEFATRFWGHVHMCFYARGIQGKQITIDKDSTGEPLIKVDRTSWLDLSLGRFHTNLISIPKNSPEEYKDHLKSIVRIYERDQNGNSISKYVVADSKNDHYAHARNYAEIALPLAMGLNENKNIVEDVI